MPASKNPTHIKKPLNSFFLYRKSKRDYIVKTYGVTKSHEISKVAGTCWAKEPESVRNHFLQLSQVEHANHKEKYPDYKWPSRSSGARSKPASKKTKSPQNLKIGDDSTLHTYLNTPEESPAISTSAPTSPYASPIGFSDLSLHTPNTPFQTPVDYFDSPAESFVSPFGPAETSTESYMKAESYESFFTPRDCLPPKVNLATAFEQRTASPDIMSIFSEPIEGNEMEYSDEFLNILDLMPSNDAGQSFEVLYAKHYPELSRGRI